MQLKCQAGRLDEHERVQVAAVCGRFIPKAAWEVIDTEAELERARGIALFSRVVFYLFCLSFGLISLRR
jgi:hypothetical protein